jgi:hypothetical protein
MGGVHAEGKSPRLHAADHFHVAEQVSFESSMHDMEDDEIDNFLAELRRRAPGLSHRR